MIKFTQEHEERLSSAYKEIRVILDKYQVEWCGHQSVDIWLEVKDKKDPTPDLRVVN